MTRKDIQL